jgi:type II secretory pathway component PulF
MESDYFPVLLSALGLILFGCAVLIALRVIAGPRDLRRDDFLQLALTVVGRLLIVTGVVGALILMLLPAAIPAAVVAVIVLFRVLAGRHESQQRALLWVLTVSAERLIPLVPAIEAFARERRGVFGHRAQRLADLLREGVRLPDALRRTRGLVPRYALPLICVGQESGALAAALRQASADNAASDVKWHSIPSRLIYLCLVPIFAASILVFVMIKIVPEFARMFNEFDVELPEWTQRLIEVSWVFVSFSFLWAQLLLVLLAIALYVVLRYMRLIQWDLPGMGLLLRRLDTAVILESLALAVDHQRPIPEAVADLARSYPKASIRLRLHEVLRDLVHGADWCQSLLNHGLIKQADLAILQAAQRVGNLPWALGEMAQSNRRRLQYRLQAASNMLFPAVILIFGAIVMFVTAALFLPLITLIERMV